MTNVPFIEEAKKKNDLSAVTMINLDDIARFTRESRNFTRESMQFMKDIRDTLRSWNARGIAIPIKLLVTGGAAAIQIDFESGSAINIDSSALNLPQQRLFALTITNYGPGTVMWATNRAQHDLNADNELDPDAEIPLSTYNASFRRLNLVAPDADATVKITALI